MQTSASKFHNFKSKKRPWSMQAGVSPSPNQSSTALIPEKPPGQSHTSSQEDTAEETDPTKTSQPDEAEPATAKPTGFRYRANVLSRSFKGRDSSSSKFTEKHRRVNSDSNNSDSSKMVETERGVAEMGVTETSSDRLQQSSLGEENNVCSDSTEGSRMELSPDGRGNGNGNEGAGGNKDLIKSPVVKTHPYSRRIDIPPVASERHRPRILTYEKSDAESPNRPKQALLVRRSTVASISPGKRLLPATPMRRGTRIGKSVSPSIPMATNFNSFATKLASSLEGVAKENSLREGSISEDAADDDVPLLAMETQHNSSPTGSTSSINSREEQSPAGSNKIKHTVQYKESKKGRYLYLVLLLACDHNIDYW